MIEEMKAYRVEVNVNFVFYVDVESINEDSAKKHACERAYEKAEEIVGEGNDEQHMYYGIAQPEVGAVEELESLGELN